MSNGKQKGSGFERETCRDLSNWLTFHLEGTARDDVFWRSSNSGGRATVRDKVKKKTHGSYGDISAIDPLGYKLLNHFILECKKGYNKSSTHDLLDRPKKAKQQQYEKWIAKAIVDAKASGLKAWQWVLIHKRDRRETMLYSPCKLLSHLGIYALCNTIEGVVEIDISPKLLIDETGTDKMQMFGCQLDKFLKIVDPKMFV